MALPYIQIGDGLIGNALLSLVEVTQELNSHWWCRVVCRNTEDQRVPVEDLLGQSVQVKTTDENGVETTQFFGTVHDVELEYEVWGSYSATITAVSNSYGLDVTTRKQYYADQTLSSIAGIIAGRHGLSIAVNAPGSKALNYVQYGETDFSFLNRLVDDYGAWMRPSEQGLEIYASFQAGTTLSWREEESLTSFRLRGQRVNPSFSGSHYDHHVMSSNTFQQLSKPPQFYDAASRLTGAVQRASQQLPSGFEPQRARAMTLDNYSDQLQAESERAMGSAVVGMGSSRKQALKAGNTVALDGTLDAKGTYGLVRLLHRWTPQGYTNDFLCTPWKSYRNTVPPAARQWNGVVPARVVDHNDPKKMGRIKVQFFWQEDGSTHWARTTSPHAGPDRGFMFMPEVGDEVAVAFEDGDPERPVVLGSLWNGVQQAPRYDFRGSDVAPNNVKRLVTKSGNRLHLSDKPGEETVFLATPNHTSLSMTEKSDQTGRQLIHLHSDGDIILSAPNGRVHIRSNTFSREVGSPGPKAEAAAAPAAAAAPSPAAPAQPGGVSGFLHGLWDGAVKPLINMVEHPIDTVKGIGHAVAHPIETTENVAHAVKSTGSAALSGNTYAMGMAVGTVGTLAIPGAGEAEAAEDAARIGGVGRLGEAADVGKAAEAADAGEVGAVGATGAVADAGKAGDVGAADAAAANTDKLPAEIPEEPVSPPVGPLTAASPRADIDALKASRADDVASARTFQTNGISDSEAANYLTTEDGKSYLGALKSAAPGATDDALADRALGQLSTGSAVPTMNSNVTSPMVKIVPSGTSVTPYSPFFTTQEDLNAAISTGKPLGDSFGLPLTSQAESYDVYQITPKLNADGVGPSTFSSPVAPTSELEGQFTTQGGATQHLIPNRGDWSAPTSVGSVPNIGGTQLSFH